ARGPAALHRAAPHAATGARRAAPRAPLDVAGARALSAAARLAVLEALSIMIRHAHDGLAEHTHEELHGPGHFHERDPQRRRDFGKRSFTVGIGGPVGSGKTALLLALCRALRDRHSLGVVTNDIFTREDAEFLMRHEALPTARIRAVETGGGPHAAIRDDISHNPLTLEELMEEVQ